MASSNGTTTLGPSSSRTRYWDLSSPETTDQQRLCLIRECIHLDQIPKEWDPTDFGEAWYEPGPNDADPAFAPKRIPSEHEVETILPPGDRSISESGRGRSGDSKFSEHIQAFNTSNNVADCYALNDAEAFNFGFGSDWRRIFDILPEIAGCHYHKPDYDASDINTGVEIGSSAYYPRRPDQEMLDDDYAGLEEEIKNSKAK
ncbi:hypothetical protein BJY01DRAFT_252220 [Aspergillus pseudoustus]|uniref:Uncharacterized protein n=1 Tax=Aspergillus pseudoustus TaxID=1810923 RepID=A0ABR4J7Z7_9EURO